MKYRVEQAAGHVDVELEREGDGWLVRAPDGSRQRLRFEPRADGSLRAVTPWGDIELWAARGPREVWLSAGERRLQARVERLRPAAGDEAGGAARGEVVAPMPGKLLRVMVQVGDSVAAGQAIAVIEAMKMENELVAPHAGVVRELLVTAPSALEKGAPIARIEAT